MGYPSMKASRANDWETASSSTVDSKSSVLSKLKEASGFAGGFLKKKQQAFAEKVQKGIKMTSGSFSSQQDQAKDLRNAAEAGPAEPQEQIQQTKAATPDDMVSTLEAMGFERNHISDAITYLGKRAANIDTVVELLVARASNREAVKNSGASSSSSFWVTLQKGPNDRLGITVDASSMPDRLQIEQVGSKGLVPSWNTSQPTLSVKAGDYITEVNGIKGSPQVLVKALANNTTIKMSITIGSNKAPLLEAKVPEPNFTSASSQLSGGLSMSTSSSSNTSVVTEVPVVPASASPVAEPVAEPSASSSVSLENLQEAMEEEAELPEVAVDVVQEESEPEEQYYAPTVHCVDLEEEADMVSIPELASKIIEIAFVQASEILIKEHEAEKSSKQLAEGSPKKAVDDLLKKTPASPVRGGA